MEIVDEFVGKTLGSCKLTRKIGEGGMGAVYLAHHLSLDKKVAVKILPPWFSQDEERIKRFIREARATAQLEHPNIIQVYDIKVTKPEGFYFIVMQYIDGESLAAAIKRRGKIPVAEATRIIRDTARALTAAHSHGIIHRDVKAENIMLNKQDDVKLMDFGLARVGNSNSSISSLGNVMGTPHYMAPEQARGETVDARSDIYSLGATYYYAITGQTPFDGTTPVSVIMKHLNEPLPDPREIVPGIPDRVSAIISKMMAKDVKKRHQSTQELIDDFDNILTELPLSSTATKTVKVTPAPINTTNKRKTLFVVSSAVLLLLALIIVIAINKHKPKPDKITAQQMFEKAKAYLQSHPMDYNKNITNFTAIIQNYPNATETTKANSITKRLHLEYGLKIRCEAFCTDLISGKNKEILKDYFDSTINQRELFSNLIEFIGQLKSKGTKLEYKINNIKLNIPRNDFAEIKITWSVPEKDGTFITLKPQIWKYYQNKWYLVLMSSFEEANAYLQSHPMDYEKNIINFIAIREVYAGTTEAEQAERNIRHLKLGDKLKDRCESFCNDLIAGKDNEVLKDYFEPNLNQEQLRKLMNYIERIKPKVTGSKYTIDNIELQPRPNNQLFAGIKITWSVPIEEEIFPIVKNQTWRNHQDKWYIVPTHPRKPLPEKSTDPTEEK